MAQLSSERVVGYTRCRDHMCNFLGQGGCIGIVQKQKDDVVFSAMVGNARAMAIMAKHGAVNDVV